MSIVSHWATSGTLWLAAVGAGGLGTLCGGALVSSGLAKLGEPGTRAVRLGGRVAAAVGGMVAVLASGHAGSAWLLPGLLVWGYALAAAATCDAATERIPTRFVRQAGVAIAALIVIAAAGGGRWVWVGLAAAAAAAAGLALLLCWRFSNAGFGDVRLAVLAGLGLVHPTIVGVASGLVAFILIIGTQVIVTVTRGGNRDSTVPYGPAIAAALMLAAAL